MSWPCSRRMMKQINGTIDKFPHCVSGKLIEETFGTTITTHISEHNLGHSHQWAYKKGHSTELLVKMIEDWRRALD